MARRGSFSPSLDPFGTSRGGLGRYNVTGDTISSLAQSEAYAVAVAWANGQASNKDYIASLTKLRDLETPGTSGYVGAQNKLEDAVYSIGRNTHVEAVNNATSATGRVAALTSLLAYDKAHLGTMTSHDSQAYHDQVDRVAQSRVDIRQTRYSDLVDKVNRGKATTQQLLDLATSFAHHAGTDPDLDTWTKAIGELHDRQADEKIADGYQQYQHNKLAGSKLLAMLDARLATLTPGSPAYKTMVSQRQDLADNVKAKNEATTEAKVQGQRATGKMSDQAYLHYLKGVYAAQQPGTTDAINAGNRLRDFTFSLAEDKLRFDVAHKRRPVGDLIRFYRSYQHGMNPGSERWRQLQTAIDSLGGTGSSGGGGGGGGGSRSGSSSGGKSKGVALSPKVLGGPSVMSDFLGGAMTGGGKVKPPPGFGDLFRIDITNVAARHWWDNNRRSMTEAFQNGSGTWTYYGKNGQAFQLPFTPSLMTEMDSMNLAYMYRGLKSAKNPKEAQTWVGRIVTATSTGQSHGATYTMDVYGHSIGALEREKQLALGAGHYGDYANLVRQEMTITAQILGVPDDGRPIRITDATNPYLTLDQKQRIQNDLAKWAPANTDQNSPFYNPDGDKVLGLIQQGAITTVSDHEGNITAATLDPSKGYVTQRSDGSIDLVPVDPADPNAFRYDELQGVNVPRYTDDNVQVTIRVDGQDMTVWQPITKPADQQGVGAGEAVYQIDRAGIDQSYIGTGGIHMSDGSQTPATYRAIIDKTNGRAATLPMLSTFTRENVTTYDPITNTSHTVATVVQWISTNGTDWYRKPSGAGLQPRLVLEDGLKLGDDGKWTYQGNAVTAAQALEHTHVWDSSDAVAAGVINDKQFGIGAPGASFQHRILGDTGYRGASGLPTAADGAAADFRPQWVIDSEEARQMSAMAYAHSRGAQWPAGQDPSQFGDEGDTRSESAGNNLLTPSVVGLDRYEPRAGKAMAGPLSLPNATGVDRFEPRAGYANTGDLLPVHMRITPDRGDPVNMGLKPQANPMYQPPPTALLSPKTALLRAELTPVKKLPGSTLAPPKPVLLRAETGGGTSAAAAHHQAYLAYLARQQATKDASQSPTRQPTLPKSTTNTTNVRLPTQTGHVGTR